MHSGDKLLPVLICPLMMKRMISIGEGREFHKARLSPMIKSTLINVDTKARLVKAWEMTP